MPALPAGKDPIEIVVSIGEEGDTQYLDFEGNVIVRYPLAITIVTGGGLNLADDATIHTWRESIRKKLDDSATFSAVTAFHRVTSSQRSPFDISALPKDLNFSIQLFTIEALETRI